MLKPAINPLTSFAAPLASPHQSHFVIEEEAQCSWNINIRALRGKSGRGENSHSAAGNFIPWIFGESQVASHPFARFFLIFLVAENLPGEEHNVA